MAEGLFLFKFEAMADGLFLFKFEAMADGNNCKSEAMAGNGYSHCFRFAPK